MNLHEQIEKVIEQEGQIIQEIDKKPLWFQNSTLGQRSRRQSEYVIEVLTKILEEEKGL